MECVEPREEWVERMLRRDWGGIVVDGKGARRAERHHVLGRPLSRASPGCGRPKAGSIRILNDAEAAALSSRPPTPS